MNIKDTYIHVGPSGTNEQALLKDWALTSTKITLTRAASNADGTADLTEEITVPTWNQNTTGQAGSVARATFGDANNGTHDANSIVSNGLWYYDSNGPATSLGATTNDGALYSQAYSNAWVGQIAQDYRNGSLFIRSKSSGTWTAWRRVLDSTCYSTYAVPLSGGTMTGALTVPSLSVTGAATFSQAINGSILGNAATASRLQNARTISLTGSVTGSGSFDGSGNLSIATTTNHTHQYVNTIGKSGSTITWSINGTAQTALDFSTTFAPYNSAGYLPLSGGTMDGTAPINFTTNKVAINFRAGHENYNSKVQYMVAGNEALVFANQNAVTSFLFYTGYNMSDLNNYESITGVKPVLQMKNNKVSINMDLRGGSDSQTYHLAVGGSIYGTSFVKKDGTSSQFLKADGSVDSNTYLTSSTNITNIAWTEKSDDANYPIAFSPNTTPTTSNNAYNTGFTFNPGTKTFNNNGCRQQYDSTNKVLKFIFD